MLSEIEIRSLLKTLLAANLSDHELARSLRDWIVRETWNMHLSTNLHVQETVGAIELCLAELDLGHLPLNELRRELQRILDSHFTSHHGREISSEDHGTMFFYSAYEPETKSMSSDVTVDKTIARDPDGNYVPVYLDPVSLPG